ncbi:MAG: hypothetical protein QOD75_2025 [Blastocatellia bacterium]|nr:hypothetical protein [Blastocatellia bacterium]
MRDDDARQVEKTELGFTLQLSLFARASQPAPEVE